MARKDFHIYTNDPDVISKINTIVILSIFNYLRKFDGRVLYPHS